MSHLGTLLFYCCSALQPNENFPLYVTLSYDTVEECAFQWSLHLPCGRIITLEALVVSLPNDEQSVTSIYMNPTVNLKSIFIGDLDPPVQVSLTYPYVNLATCVTHSTGIYISAVLAVQQHKSAGFLHCR